MNKYVIIEDEMPAANRLKHLLDQHWPNSILVIHLESVTESVTWLSTHEEYDLVFMDIHLGDGNSFDILDQVKISKPIIFTTAHDQYALPAFKHLVLDYLLKPIRIIELQTALQKYTTLFGQKQSSTSSKKWTINIGQQVKVIDNQDVVYFYTQDRITYAMLKDGKKIGMDSTLEKIEGDVAELDYFRLNRQFLITRQAIEHIGKHTKSRYALTVKYHQDKVVVSTERSPDFKKWIST